MTISEFLTTIDETHVVTAFTNNPDSIITSIKLMMAPPVEWESDTLYIGQSAQDLIYPDLPISILLCGDIQPQVDTSLHNIAFINDCDLTTLFNEVNELFYQDLTFTANYSKLLSLNLQNESLQKLIDEASLMVHNPLIVLDTSYKILCSSNTYPIKDVFWSETVKTGYCTYEFILAVNELFATQGGSSTGRQAYPITCPVSPYTKVFCNMFWHHSLIGYIIMLNSNQEVEHSHYQLLPKISENASITLSKLPNFHGIHGSMKETILYQLLNEESMMNIEVRMKTASLKTPPNMRLVTILFDSYSDTTIVSPFIKEQLLALFPSAYITEYEHAIVMLQPLNDPVSFSPLQEEGLTSFFQNAHIKIACSDKFSSFAHVKKQYRLCLDLIRTCSPLISHSEIIYFSQYRFYYLLSQIDNKEILSGVLHPALAILTNYDRENNTELYHTLSMYLEKNCNAKETASALFIHRNSLSYRIEKIIALTNIDLKEDEERFQLSYSYRINRHLNSL
ncbi:regulator of polyketide synthase expression [Lachnospiraceae bacterium KM106-2]|nr:regulator of polyketide synthase expression [Lachnospiraceae bacterium KM106-2]